MRHIEYYIDGEPVTARAARRYFDKACEQAEAYCIANGIPLPYPQGGRLELWERRGSPKGAEKLHSITAIDEAGGLEVIINHEEA